MRGRPAAAALILVAAAGCLAPARPAAAAETVAVSGRIVNATAGGAPPGALGVMVVQLQSEQASGVPQDAPRKGAQAAEDGTFEVCCFESSKGSRFLIGTNYQNITYSTVQESSGGQVSGAVLKVFEPTDDESVIALASDTLTVVKGADDTLEVIQLLSYRNRSDRTFVGSAREAAEGADRLVLQLPVPAGAFDIAPLEGIGAGRLAASAAGPATLDPVIPGDARYSLVYKVRVPRSGWRMERRVVYPTQRVDFLVGEGLSFQAGGFRLDDSPTIGGVSYRRFRGGPFEPGAELVAAVAAPQQGGGGLGAGAALVAVTAAVLAITPFVLRRRRRKPSAPPTAADRDRLITEIASLDRDFEEGHIDADEYRSERERKKSELAELTRILTRV